MRSPTLSTAFIWFGAAISIAEIFAGFETGPQWLAIVLGHLVGGFFLFAAALIGAHAQKGAMETTVGTFGRLGSKFFSVLNILQLMGWLAVMSIQATAALTEIWNGFDGPYTHILLGGLVAIWVFIGIGSIMKIARVIMIALALLMTLLTVKLLQVPAADEPAHMMTFWQAFELSIAMPLSWVPVIADYTKNATNARSSVVSAIVYTLASIWMYFVGVLIGLGGEGATIAKSVVAVGLAGVGIPIIIASTVTTNIIAAHSSGESSRVVWGKLSSRWCAVGVCAVGTFLALTGIMNHYVGFLYFIASVFSPMAAVLVVGHWVQKRPHQLWNFIAWAIGFAAYQLLPDPGIGPSLTSIIVAGILSAAARTREA